MRLDLSKYQYAPCSENIWVGRSTPPELGPQYWYQVINQIDLSAKLDFDSFSNKAIAIIGYVCEEGVRRNKGRVGTKDGPAAIRKKLGKLAFHHKPMQVYDLGNIQCDHEELETCQTGLAEIVGHTLSKGILPIVIGGGHDIAYGHFNGINQHVSSSSKGKIGIINFDAHFDLRPDINGANSGTPFYQILNENPDKTQYLAIGIQKPSNTKSLFDIADQLGVDYILSDDCILRNVNKVAQQIENFVAQVDHIYITIDMDGFSSAYAPGVSAPSPFGMHPDFVTALLSKIFSSNKVVSCDIAELNPQFDIDQMTTNLAARLIDNIASYLL